MQQVERLSPEALAERYGAAWNSADLETIMALQGDDMVFHLHLEGFEPAVGPGAVRSQFAFFFSVWKPMHFQTEALHLAGGLLVRQFRFRARLVEPFPLGSELLQPSDRTIDVPGADIITTRDGLVRSKHTYIDSFAIRHQLQDAEPSD